MSKSKRDYEKEYRDYQGTPAQVKRRAQRNAARRKMVKLGHAKPGDGKDVDHIDRRTSNNKRSNLRMLSASKNRSRK